MLMHRLGHNANAQDGHRRARSGIARHRKEPVVTYVDGFVAAVPTANRTTFLEHAEAAAVVFKEFGTLAVV